MPSLDASIVIPNWNGRRWLPGCLDAIARLRPPPLEVIVVDNGSDDDSCDYLAAQHPTVRVVALSTNTGFAHAANRGLRAARAPLVALVNTDVVLAPDWLGRMAVALRDHPEAASVTGKLLELDDSRRVYDAGDVLRRDGACEQRGRFGPDDGRWDAPDEVFGACAGAALYRRAPVLELGGFDERYFAYLEDADLALRLRLAGWRCRYEPALARHAGEGSSGGLRGGHRYYIARGALLLVAKAFPARWLPLVAYRQLAWARAAARDGHLGVHLRGVGAGLRLALGVLRSGERATLRREARVPIDVVVPPMPIRGPRALGHPSRR